MKTYQPRTKKFQRNKEDFVCEECELCVYGDGYRNHCPKCLVSKHVDENPGDRAAECGGLMDVTDVAMDHGKVVFTHTGRPSGHQKKNKAHVDDDMQAITQKMKDVHAS